MKKLVPVLLGFTLLAVPMVVFGQENNNGIVGEDPITVICEVLQSIKNIILAIGLGIAVIILIVGGIQYMTAGGNAENSDWIELPENYEFHLLNGYFKGNGTLKLTYKMSSDESDSEAEEFVDEQEVTILEDATVSNGRSKFTETPKLLPNKYIKFKATETGNSNSITDLNINFVLMGRSSI